MMKYILTINQKKAIELGLTNTTQVHILELIIGCTSWAKPIVVNNEAFHWIARQTICEELPLLGIKPDTVYRHLKKLDELAIIEYIKDGRKDLVRLTSKGRSYSFTDDSKIIQDSEKNPNKLGEKSESDSEKNPTDQYTNIDHNIYMHFSEKREEAFEWIWSRVWSKNKKDIGKSPGSKERAKEKFKGYFNKKYASTKSIDEFKSEINDIIKLLNEAFSNLEKYYYFENMHFPKFITNKEWIS